MFAHRINGAGYQSGNSRAQGSSPRHALKLKRLAQGQLSHHARKHLPRKQPQGVTLAVHSRASLQAFALSEKPDRRLQPGKQPCCQGCCVTVISKA